MERLSNSAIDETMASFPEWSQTGDAIQRTFQFGDFVQAMKFVNRVAEVAEAAQHHPDMLIRWDKVTLTLSTHDAGGITHLDFDLAGKCDQFALSMAQDAPKKPA